MIYVHLTCNYTSSELGRLFGIPQETEANIVLAECDIYLLRANGNKNSRIHLGSTILQQENGIMACKIHIKLCEGQHRIISHICNALNSFVIY